MMPDTHVPPSQHPFDLPGYKPSDDEKTWALIAHVSALVAAFLGPIVALVAKGNESKWVRAHAIESLNFNLTLFIGYLVGTVLSVVAIGLCLLIPLAGIQVIFSIIAGVKAFQGQAYRYPFAIRLIKE